MQQLILAGTVGRDAEVRQTQSGDAVLNFSLAVDNGKDRDGNKRDATWFDCSIWGKRATDRLASAMSKGTRVTVIGRPTAREYNGKVYLGCSVYDFTFQGGGQREQSGGYGGERSARQEAPPSRELDDEIPF